MVASAREQSMRAMLVDELPPPGCYGDEGSAAVLMVTLNEATFIGVLPY
jgi:hypothetical protein